MSHREKSEDRAATVALHLSHIFGKLDVHSRAELTAQAVRRHTA